MSVFKEMHSFELQEFEYGETLSEPNDEDIKNKDDSVRKEIDQSEINHRV